MVTGRKLEISDIIDDNNENNETTKYDSYRRNDKISGYRKQTEYGAKKYIKP